MLEHLAALRPYLSRYRRKLFLGLLAVVATVVCTAVVGFALSTVLGLWLLWGVVRSGRRRAVAPRC